MHTVFVEADSTVTRLQVGSGAHTASHLMDTWFLSPEVKQPVFEVYQLRLSIDKVKNGWSYTSAPPVCIYGMDKDNFYLYNVCRYIYNKNILMSNCSG
jgi:hypothetical protein